MRQAQSCIIPAIDAFLGIEHEVDDMQTYLHEMRVYMPTPHQQFLTFLLQLTPPVRDDLAAIGNEEEKTMCQSIYNDCVRALAQFRSKHVGYADRYIKQPGLKDTASDVGTGGTDFVKYLRKHVRETKDAYINGGGDEAEAPMIVET